MKEKSSISINVDDSIYDENSKQAKNIWELP